MSEYTISYVLTTYNKLPYLKEVLKRLIIARKLDEEIVVADGGSKDGTPEYLQGLFDAGLIQQYVSERDKGEAHGFNKCMLMARGELVKIITDDDAFCYPAIREAAGFMLSHPEIDVLCANSGLILLEDLTAVQLYSYNQKNYLDWYHNGTVTHMIGLPLIIRRSSLALTGLFNPSVVLVDAEFTYRITALNANLAWSSAMLSVRLDNPQSNFRNLQEHIRKEEDDRMRYYYDKEFRNDPVSILRQRIPFKDWLNRPIEWLKRPVRPSKKAIFRLLKISQWEPEIIPFFPTNYQLDANDDPITTAFEIADTCMATYNAQYPTKFLVKANNFQITKAMPPTQ